MVDQVGRWLRRRQGIERNPIYQLASDVAEGRMSPEQAYQSVERRGLLNGLADGDLWDLDREAARIAVDDPQRALLVVRLAILAARYKGFDRVLIDCNLRAADLLAELEDRTDQELHLREALAAAERIASVNGQRRALSRLARLAFDTGDTDRARELLGRQLEAGREDADTLEDVETAVLLGDLARSDGDASGAREFYHRAARSARRVGHFPGVVDALLRQVLILREIGDYEGAVLLLQQAQDAAEQTIDTRLQVEVAIQTAALLAETHQYTQARNQLLTALERARSISDLTMESRCLTGLARVEQRSGHLRDAATHYRELSDLEQRLGNRSAAIRALLESAETLIEMRDAPAAQGTLEVALQLSESLDEPVLHQRVLGLLGLAYGALDRRNEALDCLTGALQVAHRSGDVQAEGRWLLGIGEVLLQFGETDDAMAAARRSLDAARQIGSRRLESQALALMGSVNIQRGIWREAEECLQRALGIARERDDFGEQLHYLQVLAQLSQHSGQFAAAVKHLRQALEVASLMDVPETRARLHGQLARLYQRERQLPEAEEHFRAAAIAADEAESPTLLARSLRSLGTVQDLAGNADEALETYERGLAVTEEIGDLRSAAVLHYNVSALLAERERYAEARIHLNRSIEQAMAAGDYRTADAGRALLQWVNATSPSTEMPPAEDVFLGEMAVGDDTDQFRELLRG